jgi:hypothetical protein
MSGSFHRQTKAEILRKYFKDAGIVKEIRKNVDLFRESMDSFRFDSSVFKRIDSWIRFVTQFSKDSFRGFVS